MKKSIINNHKSKNIIKCQEYPDPPHEDARLTDASPLFSRKKEQTNV